MIRYYNPQTSCIELVFLPLYHLVVTQPSFSTPPTLIIRFDTLRALIPTSILFTGPRRNGGTGRGLSRSRKREPRHDKEICIKAWFFFFFLVYRRPARPGGCRIVVFFWETSSHFPDYLDACPPARPTAGSRHGTEGWSLRVKGSGVMVEKVGMGEVI